jgi:hypothetical protein
VTEAPPAAPASMVEHAARAAKKAPPRAASRAEPALKASQPTGQRRARVHAVRGASRAHRGGRGSVVSERRIENTSRQRWYRRWCIGGGRLVGSRERSVDTPQQKGAKHNERARLRAARRARAFEHRACDEAARPRPHGPCADERDGATCEGPVTHLYLAIGAS